MGERCDRECPVMIVAHGILEARARGVTFEHDLSPKRITHHLKRIETHALVCGGGGEDDAFAIEPFCVKKMKQQGIRLLAALICARADIFAESERSIIENYLPPLPDQTDVPDDLAQLNLPKPQQDKS